MFLLMFFQKPLDMMVLGEIYMVHNPISQVMANLLSMMAIQLDSSLRSQNQFTENFGFSNKPDWYRLYNVLLW